MMRAAPSPEEARRHNLGTLLRHIHLRGAASRAELAEGMGLNRSTIMALTGELTAAGVVREELPREVRRRAGRPSLVVRPESTRVYVLAFDIGVDRLVAARVGLGGVILERRESARPRGPFDPDEVVGALASFTRQLVRRADRDAVCVGAGAAFSGIVRSADGMLRYGPNLGATDVSLGDALSRRLGLGVSVAIGNDANLGALAEHRRGVGVGCNDLIYLHGDVGIGGGIIVGGRLLGGADGYGGEVGHMVVNPRGRRCACGARGCWETEIGEYALLHAAGRDGQCGVEAVLSVIEAAGRGDTTAQAALRQVAEWLGLGVANLVNIFSPEVIVFGGTLRHIYLAAAAQLRSRLNATALTVCREHVRLRTTALGADAPLLGAAELAFERLLADPLEAGV